MCPPSKPVPDVNFDKKENSKLLHVSIELNLNNTLQKGFTLSPKPFPLNSVSLHPLSTSHKINWSRLQVTNSLHIEPGRSLLRSFIKKVLLFMVLLRLTST